MTKNPPHILATGLVRDALYHIVPQGWCVYSQDPVRVQRSMPEPDVMVVRGDLRQYGDRRISGRGRGPDRRGGGRQPRRDQVFKKAIYAQSGIPVYWLVNLIEQRIEEYTDPAGADESADYRQRHDYSSSDQVPLMLDGRCAATISVGELLP